MNEQMILGYQHSPVTGKFIGEYWFPNNQDQEAVVLPPNTTLTAPPVDVPKMMSAYWSGDRWFIADDPDKAIPPLVIDDYAMLMPDYVLNMKQRGWWSAENEANYQQALLAKAAADIVVTEEGGQA